MIRRILVATDGHTAAVGALRMAQALSRRHGAQVSVVGVLEPIQGRGTVGSETMRLAQRGMQDAELMALQRRIEGQIAMAGPEYVAWPVTVVLGPIAPVIVRVSRDQDADLIVLGLGRHGIADRWFGSETALRVMRLANVPVLERTIRGARIRESRADRVGLSGKAGRIRSTAAGQHGWARGDYLPRGVGNLPRHRSGPGPRVLEAPSRSCSFQK